MRVLVGEDFPTKFTILKASMAEFPALNGHSVSCFNQPSPHPSPTAELLFLVAGSLEPGFVGTTNKLLTQSLQAGDMFVFPKGLVHFQYNVDANNPALAVSAFGSGNAGTVTSQDSICPLNLHGHNTKYKTRVMRNNALDKTKDIPKFQQTTSTKAGTIRKWPPPMA
ncbi:Germin [Gossypium australe]|uniref:Germin-like protein n=1 Tax=Gossypium australe TaxID=47621 RepID=A0A5B6X993_9ROSI|nr:Germin [Gossypium australe]